MWQNRRMFDGLPDSIGRDCCVNTHGEWEFLHLGKADHGRAALTFTCSGCGTSAHAEAYKNDDGSWTYTNPDGQPINLETPNRPRRHR